MKTFSILRIFLLASFVVSYGELVSAELPQSPEIVLKEYLRLDLNGHGLESDDYKKMFALTDWLDGPGWDMVAVIRGYKIGKTIMEGNRAIIPVTYDLVGIIDGGVSWDPYNTKNKSYKSMIDICANYELRQINGQWKIHSPQLMPHISINVALKHHESLLPGSDGNPQIQKDMKKVVDILRKLARGK